jgi:hypothetical protein
MATSPLLAFIDSRTNQAKRKAKSRHCNNVENGKRLHSAPKAARQKITIGSYIYAVIVDGVALRAGPGNLDRTIGGVSA